MEKDFADRADFDNFDWDISMSHGICSTKETKYIDPIAKQIPIAHDGQ